MMPKTRSRKFTPIFSSRRFIVLGIILMCAIRLELNLVHRGHLSSLAFGNVWVLWACTWLCITSPASLLIGCGVFPRRMTSGRLLSVQGQPLPYRCCSSLVLSRQSPVTRDQEPQSLRGQALSPCLLRRKKDVFGLWSWTSKLLLKSMRVSDNHASFFLPKVSGS